VALHRPESDMTGWYSSLRNYGQDMELDGIPELELPKEHQGHVMGTMKTMNVTTDSNDEVRRENNAQSLPKQTSTSSQSA